MSMFPISRVFITPYFSLLTVFCSLVLFVLYRSDQPERFSNEKKIAKWGSIVYLLLGLTSFIFSRLVS